MGVPIIQDVTSGASAIVRHLLCPISKSTYLKKPSRTVILSELLKAAQYGESLPSMVDDMNTMGSSVEVKQRLGSAVENLDILAYAGLDQLKQRCPNLRPAMQGIVL